MGAVLLDQLLALAMALHELATNALKHGALSVSWGYVAVACETDPDDGAKVCAARAAYRRLPQRVRRVWPEDTRERTYRTIAVARLRPVVA
jgi:two-component sensor histidine kinase